MSRLFGLILFACASPAVISANWEEALDGGMDAGIQTGAQTTSGFGQVDVIVGNINPELGDHVDCYCIRVDDKASFYATTNHQINPSGSSSGFDSQLWLWSAGGTRAISANEDSPPGVASVVSDIDGPIAYTQLPVDPVTESLSNGSNYLVCLSYFPQNALDAADNRLVNWDNFGALSGPNPDAGSFSHYSNPVQFGSSDYAIALQGASFCGQLTPTPTQLSIIDAQPNPQLTDHGITVEFEFSDQAVPDDGVVTVTDGENQCDATPQQGQCVLVSDAIGPLSIVASYSGADGFAASSSASHDVTLLPPMLPELISRGDGPGTGKAIPSQLSNDSLRQIDHQGELIVFMSDWQLLPNDTNGFQDIYLKTRATGQLELISVTPDGRSGNFLSDSPSISSDGRYVVFDSFADDLVENDENGETDVFVRDRQLNTTELVSRRYDGMQIDGDSYLPQISDDGRYVLFQTMADGVVADDDNAARDLYLVDRTAETIERVSLRSDGTQIPEGISIHAYSLSSDGRYVSFTAEGNDILPGVDDSFAQVFLRDLTNNTTTLISMDEQGNPGNESSYASSLDSGASSIVFSSLANNLVPSDSEDQTDIFLRDRLKDETTRITEASGVGANGFNGYPLITSDGMYVVFNSRATNLATGTDNSNYEILLFDRSAGTLETVTSNEQGNSPNRSSTNPSISGNGEVITFSTQATDLVHGIEPGRTVFAEYDRSEQQVATVEPAITHGSLGNDYSVIAASSLFGRHVVYASAAQNLLPPSVYGVEDIVLRDRALGINERITVTTSDDATSILSYYPSISDDGRYVSFTSIGFLDGDTNFRYELFLRDRHLQTTRRIGQNADGDAPDGDGYFSAVAPNGEWVAFSSRATNLVPDDSNGVGDMFLYNVASEALEIVSLGVNGEQANGRSTTPSFSADGRYLAYRSEASNLVSDDSNDAADLFILDLDSRQVTRVTSDGTEANDNAFRPSVSESGRWIAFDSGATNYIADDSNEKFDVFVVDMETMQVERVSVRSDGGEIDHHSFNPDISRDGRYVTYSSRGSNVVDDQFSGYYGIYMYDRETGQTARVDLSATGEFANGYSVQTKLDPSGQVVVFDSAADNLIATDSNGARDVFLTNNPLTGFAGEVRWMKHGIEPAEPLKRGDGFGQAVAIDGDRMVVSAWRDDEGGNNVGAAYVFEKSDGAWQTTGKLVPFGLSAGQRMGRVVALDGDTVVLANWFANAAGAASGNAVVFELINDAWTQTANLLPADAEAKDAFGVSVDIDQGRIVVGADGRGDFTTNGGAAFVYEKSGSAWVETARLGANNLGRNDRFGVAVAIDGDRIAAGAWGDDDEKENSGAIYLFEFEDGSWGQTDKLKIEDAGRGDRLGTALALDGDSLLAGVPLADELGANSGAAYVFDFDGAGWTQMAKLVPTWGSAGDRFGSAVDLNQSMALIGSPQCDDEGLNQGAAYLFTEHAPDQWSAARAWYDAAPNRGDFFGQSVSLSNGVTVIGAPLADGQLNNAGGARVEAVD